MQGSLVETDFQKAMKTEDWKRFPFAKKGHLLSRIDRQDKENKEKDPLPNCSNCKENFQV